MSVAPFEDRLADDIKVGDWIIPGPKMPAGEPRNGVEVIDIDKRDHHIVLFSVRWARRQEPWGCMLAAGRYQTVRVHLDVPHATGVAR